MGQVQNVALRLEGDDDSGSNIPLYTYCRHVLGSVCLIVPGGRRWYGFHPIFVGEKTDTEVLTNLLKAMLLIIDDAIVTGAQAI